jgi:hypothetical protein
MFNRAVKLSFVKDKKNGEETSDGTPMDLEAIQDFIVGTVAGVGFTVVTVKVISTVCDVVRSAASSRL